MFSEGNVCLPVRSNIYKPGCFHRFLLCICYNLTRKSPINLTETYWTRKIRVREFTPQYVTLSSPAR